VSRLDGVVPTDSQEHLISHLGEASSRIQRVIFGFLIAAVIWAFFVDEIFATWLAMIPLGEGAGSLTIYSPYSWLDTKWTAVGLLAIWTVLPWLTMEMWKFAKPGLLPREKAWLGTMVSSGLFGGTLIIVIGWLWGFPRLVEMANTAGMIDGVGAHYDVVSLFAMALSLTWFVLLLYLLTISLTVGRALGLISEDPLDPFRLRLHFVAIVMLYVVTPPAFQGLFLVTILTLVFVSEFIASLSPISGNPRGRMATTVFDAEGGERRVLFVDCSCEDVCPRINPNLLSDNIGVMVANSLCLADNEVEQLCERVSRERLTDVVIGGCDGLPTPGTLKHSLAASNCQLSGLNRLSTAIHSADANQSIQDFANRIDLARASAPWSLNGQSKAQLRVISENTNGVPFISSSNGIQAWGIRPKGEEVWVHTASLCNGLDVQFID